MSRLIEKLTKQRQSDPQPMGFMAASQARTQKTQLLLLVEITTDNLDKLSQSLKPADAVFVDVSKADDFSVAEKACQDKDAVLTGGWLKNANSAVLKKALVTECDFIIFSSAAPVTLTRKETLGKILEIDMNLTDGLIRAAGDLPVDAVIVTGKPSEPTLTLNRLMSYQRLLNLVNKPLLVTIPDDLSSSELQSLWDIGIGGVVVEVSDEKSAQKLPEMRAAIDKLEAPAFRKKSKAMAILPKPQAEATVAPEPDEQEEEDE